MSILKICTYHCKLWSVYVDGVDGDTPDSYDGIVMNIYYALCYTYIHIFHPNTSLSVIFIRLSGMYVFVRLLTTISGYHINIEDTCDHQTDRDIYNKNYIIQIY